MQSRPDTRIFNAQVRHKVYLMRLENGIAARLRDYIQEIDEDLIFRLNGKMDKLSKVDLERLARGIEGKTTRSSELSAYIKAIGVDASQELSDRIQDELEGFGEYELDFQARRTGEALGGSVGIILPSIAIVSAAVRTRPIQGKLLKEYSKEWAEARRSRISQAIRIGVAEGADVKTILDRIKGTKALAFKDGTLEISRRSAESIARTAATYVATFAKSEFTKSNKDLFSGERWTAILDSKTSDICRALDGTVFPVGEGRRPPAHLNCRSFMVPIPKEQGDNDAKVKASPQYDEWLRKQPNSVVKDVLGKTKAELFLNGGLSSKDLYDFSKGKSYTLNELKEREPKSFEKAGLDSKEESKDPQ